MPERLQGDYLISSGKQQKEVGKKSRACTTLLSANKSKEAQGQDKDQHTHPATTNTTRTLETNEIACCKKDRYSPIGGPPVCCLLITLERGTWTGPSALISVCPLQTCLGIYETQVAMRTCLPLVESLDESYHRSGKVQGKGT